MYVDMHMREGGREGGREGREGGRGGRGRVITYRQHGDVWGLATFAA